MKAAITAADMASREDAKRQTVTASEAWAAYLVARRPQSGARHDLDHVAKAAPGGVPGKRSKSLQAGILAGLLLQPLRDIDAATIEARAAREAKTRPTSTRLAWRLLKAFLGWCAEQADYAGAAERDRDAAGGSGLTNEKQRWHACSIPRILA